MATPPVTGSIRVLLVDDHRVLREGLRVLLDAEERIEVVGEAGDGAEAVALAITAAPDVIVMDIAMPGMNGVEATRRILAERPEARVIALSVYADRAYVERTFAAGARGYLLKTAGRAELMRALEAVHAGRSYVSPELAGAVAESLVRVGEEEAASPLGPREREVLKLLAEGCTSRRIAGQLGISEKTVETHRRNIMRKTALHSVAELTKYAIRLGLTSLES